MTKNGNDILELKFEGNGINPSSVKPSEIASLIEEFESALLSTIKAQYPAIDTNEVLFTFDSIKNESIGLNFLPNIYKIAPEIKTVLISSYTLLTTSISQNDFSKLSNDTIDSLKKISTFTKKYNCDAKFKYNGEQLSIISPKTEIKNNKPGLLKGDITIYGELVDAGGDNPNIHIKLNNYTVIIKTDKTKAKELASRLYEFVGLKGQAKWDVLNSKIIEFKLHEVLDYNPVSVSEAFDELRGLFSGWDKYNNDEDINKQLLKD